MSIPLFFVRRFGSTASGSTQMRGTNLPNLVDHYVGANLKVRRISAPSHNKPRLQRLWAQAVPKDAIYFMTKGLLKMDREAALILKSRVRAVCYDYVDQDPTRVNSDQADIHVCSSFAQKDQLEALQEQGQFAPGPCHVVLHNADERLTGLRPPACEKFSAAYIGTRSLTYIPDVLTPEVTILNGANVNEFNKVFDKLPHFNLHYCFRGASEVSELLVKPFTKGVTAAMCHANLVTSRNVWDAQRLLGADYPFLAPDNSEEAILTAFETAKSAWGTKTWDRGLEAMARVRELVSPSALGKAMVDLGRLAGVD